MFFRPATGAYDDGADRSPYGHFWFEPIGVHTHSGVRVTPDSAMRLGTAFRCVEILAKTFAVLPFGLFKPRAGGVGRDAQPKHWLYKLISRRPNRFQDPYMWRQMVMGHIALRGNAYNRIYANGAGVVTDLIPLHPDRVRVDVFPSGDYRYLLKQPNGKELPVARGSIWHLRGVSTDGITGISPLAYAREAIGRGLAAQAYGAQYFANSGAPTGGWIGMNSKFKDETDRQNFIQAWKNARTGEDRHATPVLEGGMEYHELAIKNDEAQFIETMKFSATDLCRFFGVPPHLAYDLTQSTNNNIEQQSLDFVTYTVLAIVRAWCSSMQYEFLDDEDDLEPDFDLTALLKADSTARGNLYKTMFGTGAWGPNDIRVREGGNPVPGGDQRFIPVNMTPLKENMEPPAPKLPPPKSDGEEEDDKEGDEVEEGDAPPGKKPRGVRLSAMAAAAAERIARREAAAMHRAFRQGEEALREAFKDHARFVSAAMGIDLSVAERYCAERRAYLRADTSLTDYETTARCQLERLAVNGSL